MSFHQSTAAHGLKQATVAHVLAITQTLTACLSPAQIHRAPPAHRRFVGRPGDNPPTAQDSPSLFRRLYWIISPAPEL
jgi:hypothetical protein